MVKASALAVLLVLVVLFAATSFTKSEERERTAARYFTSGEIARGQQYSRGGRLLFWSATALDLLVLAALAATSFGARLVRGAESLAGGRFVLAVLAVAAIAFLVEQLVSLPLAVYAGFVRQKAWGLTDRTFGSWASDYGKATLLSIVIGAVLTAGFYLLLRHLPRAWWIAAGVGSGGVGVVLAWLLPLVIAPLFNTFTPLANTEWAPLEPDVRAMLQRANLPVREVLVMDASRQGRNTNAYFSGFGRSRRIVLYDTLLQSHTGPEVLSILAHETGHWTHNHIVKGLVLGTLGAFFGFFLLDRILRACIGLAPLNLRALDDPAGLPLVLLLSLLGSLAAMPIANGISRMFETEADRTALETGGDPQVFIEAEKRLVRDNIGDPTPSDVRVLFFADHPPALDRIAAAEAFKAR